jgi:hypothetical protein
MVRSLEFWFALNRRAFVAFAVSIFVFAFVAWFLIRSRSQPLPSALTQGIVISAGSVTDYDYGFCPDAHRVAPVRLPDNRVVQAQVASAATLLPGSLVWVRQWVTACNRTGYEVVLNSRTGT